MTKKMYAAIAVAILLAAVFAAGWAAYNHAIDVGRQLGAAAVQGKWDVERAAMREEIEALKLIQGKITTIVETQYLDRVRVIREQGQTIIKEVTKYVPIDTPALPGGFRLYHDAAASGSALPDPAGIADAAPVAAQDLAVTVAANYETCRANAATIEAWQDWATQQAKATGTAAARSSEGPASSRTAPPRIAPTHPAAAEMP